MSANIEICHVSNRLNNVDIRDIDNDDYYKWQIDLNLILFNMWFHVIWSLFCGIFAKTFKHEQQRKGLW
jgi:hypothetical protein